MGLLQRWLDEPDESIARFAKTFYVLTYAFMAAFVLQMVQVVWRASRGEADPTDFVGPSVTAFVTLTLYNLAIDGRRSYKQVKRDRDASAPPDPKP